MSRIGVFVLRDLVPAAAGVLLMAGNSGAYALPDSGQTVCYQGALPYVVVIPCEGTGQDGEYDVNPMLFTDNGDGTVTDGNTGLVWQREDGGATYNWYRAAGVQDAVRNPEGTDVCGSLALGDADDWRLPTVGELLDLVDYGVAPPGPAIRIGDFPGTQGGYYWSSTVRGYPYGVDFSGGWANHIINGPWDELPVRCVRGAGAPGPVLVDRGNGTVTDLRTGLTWQQGQSDSLNWAAALAYCEGLDLGDSTSWRLPNIKELWTLVDVTQSPPYIDHDLFPGITVVMDHWTSTTNPTNDAAWGVYFYSGMVENLFKHHSYRARCVTDVNQRPYFDPPQVDQAVVAGGVLNLTVAGGDVDLSDVVSASLVAGPPGATFDETAGLFSWAPGIGDVGVHQATFRVTDNGTPVEWADATIAITVKEPGAPTFEDAFADGTAAGDPEWTVAKGRWSVASGRYRSGWKPDGVTWISMFNPVTRPLATGVIQARIKLTNRYRRLPNGSLVFGYADTGRYRYVEVRRGRLLIGQEGEIDGVPAGIKRSRRIAMPIGKFRTFRVELGSDGEVNVYQGTKRVAFHQFPAAVPGGIGLGARGAQTLFDDVKVWDEPTPGP